MKISRMIKHIPLGYLSKSMPYLLIKNMLTVQVANACHIPNMAIKYDQVKATCDF